MWNFNFAVVCNCVCFYCDYKYIIFKYWSLWYLLAVVRININLDADKPLLTNSALKASDQCVLTCMFLSPSRQRASLLSANLTDIPGSQIPSGPDQSIGYQSFSIFIMKLYLSLCFLAVVIYAQEPKPCGKLPLTINIDISKVSLKNNNGPQTDFVFTKLFIALHRFVVFFFRITTAVGRQTISGKQYNMLRIYSY